MKIAILASNNGEKALYIHDFFKEGNRIKVDCLLTDNPESEIARRMREEGIDVIFMSPGQQMAELSRLLKARDVELLVVDDFTGDLPAELKESFGEAIVFPTRRENAPLEVIETTDRMKAAANAAFYQPTPPPEKKEEKNVSETPDGEPSVVREWAEVLEVEIDKPDKEDVEVSGTSPNSPQPPEPPRYGPQPPQPPYGQTQQYGQQHPQYGPQPPQHPYGRQHLSEPMPDNYLVWSVLLTIFCCLIPGIIAIVFSASVSSKYYAGDLEGAKRASRNAQIWCIISIVAGIIWASLYFPLVLFLS